VKKNLTTKDVAKSLQKADILLTHGCGLVSKAIRFGTRSHWNHVVIVFVLSDNASSKSRGYQRTFIIEAQAHGIDIHPIDKYLNNEKQDMAILRLPEDTVPTSIREDFLRRVRGFALEEIDAGVRKGWIEDRVAAALAMAWAKVRAGRQVSLVSDGISAQESRALGYVPFPTVQEALEEALRRHGPEARVHILPRAAETLPIES